MAPDYVMVGGIVLDWVKTATGELNCRGCGGNALYSAVGAYLWSDSVAAVGRAGQDFPEAYLAAFGDAGIDVSAVRRMPQQHAVLSGFVYDDLGNRTTYRSPRVLERWGQSDPETLAMLSDAASERRPVGFEIAFGADPGDVPAHFWQARGFHLASWTHSVQRAFAETLRRHEIPFTLDPGRQVAPDLLKETLKIAPAFLPSESDVTHLLGEPELDEALERLAGMGPSVVAVKLGAAGSTVCNCRTGERHHVPAFPTRAKDPTGAGDAYCGGFLVGWIETGDVREAALRGTVSASFVVEDFDARYALQFSRRDAEERLRILRSMAT